MSDRIVTLDGTRHDQWQAYVDAHPQRTLFHGLKWKSMLEATFGHEHRYLMALREDQVVGVLPLVGIKSIFFGRSLVSVPFAVYGGILSDDAAVTQALRDAALEARKDFGASYVEFRHLDIPEGLGEIPTKDLHVTFMKDLPEDPEEVLKSMPRKSRAEARKARNRFELEAVVEPPNIDGFHALFAQNKRSLGSPIFPRSLFQNIADALGDDCYNVTIKKDGEVLSSVMNFIVDDTVMAYYSGSTPASKRMSADNLMYVAVMEDAIQRGVKRFDFGRSRRDTGAFEFKKNQGFEPRDLSYQFLLPDGEELPRLDNSNAKFDFAKKILRSVPLPIAERLGSYIVKRTPI